MKIKRILILFPGKSDAVYAPLKKVARLLRSRDLKVDLISNISSAVKSTNQHKYAKILVVLGVLGKDEYGRKTLLNARQAYHQMKRVAKSKRSNICVLDGWLWMDIPKKGMILLEPDKLIQTILACV